MKQLCDYLKSRPIALASLFVIGFLYLVLIFAEFIAPYSPSDSFAAGSFHPGNVEFSSGSFSAREYRVLDSVSFDYAKVKGLSHRIVFFARGEPYKLFGLIPCSRHLFGTERDETTGELYPVFLFGADNLGRDLFSRIVYGSRISLTIGFVASAISLVLAVFFGGIAGYYGGKTDWAVMRFSEFFMLIPGIYLILFLRSLLNSKMDSGQSYMIITVILSLVGWPGSARTLRGMIHALKREEFVLDASLEGIPGAVIIVRHIIPQITSLLIVSTTLSIPGFIMSETTLSYLGLGIADPAVSWGSLINRDISTLSNLKHFPWLLIPVWLLLAVTLAFNFLGDALRDFYDPYHTVFRKRTFRRRTNGAKNDCSARPAESKEFSAAIPSALLLRVSNLHVDFAIRRGTARTVIHSVRGVSFDMKKGEILGIVGESGSGKTVTTTAIPALLPPNAHISGSIFYNNARGENDSDFVELTALSSGALREFRGKKIGMIFQEPGRSFDPLQNMESVFFETFRNADASVTRAAARKLAVELLSEVGLPDPERRLCNFPHQFSGGQLQRIGIALALAQGCRLLIADEPTTALDVTVQAQIIALLRRLNTERGLSIIFISHNIQLVADLCSDIIVMYGGLIMEKNTSANIMNHPRHPYTQALLGATPEFGTHYSTGRLASIPGRVTDPASPEPGCPFMPRCRYKRESCARPDSQFSCWKAE